MVCRGRIADSPDGGGPNKNAGKDHPYHPILPKSSPSTSPQPLARTAPMKRRRQLHNDEGGRSDMGSKVGARKSKHIALRASAEGWSLVFDVCWLRGDGAVHAMVHVGDAHALALRAARMRMGA